MVIPNTSKIDQSWPECGIEQVEHCPYCGSDERELAYKDVQDWSFYCAPGRWTYWDCKRCDAIYLNPRPTAATVGQAYDAYYTHSSASKGSPLKILKERIKNECWSHWFNANISPRLHLPDWLAWLLAPLKSRLFEPFGLRELVDLPKGSLMDVGCGNGDMLGYAKQLGWRTIGLEIDPTAVHAARAQGLNVLNGTYERLSEYRQSFDCIICSHVLEHVHNPQDMLMKLKTALKPGGTLLLSLPNATSVARYHFRENWRGLEAPRHLSIPSVRQLKIDLEAMGFNIKQRQLNAFPTAAASSCISRRAAQPSYCDKKAEKILMVNNVPVAYEQQDFVEFVCLKMTNKQ